MGEKMSKILDFFSFSSPDSKGRYFEDYLDLSFKEMEECHDYIQWMFPTNQPSQCNPNSPVLTKEDIQSFRKCPYLQHRLRMFFLQWLSFSGIKYYHRGMSMTMIDANALKNVFVPRLTSYGTLNHNWLRITRVLTCLKLLGLDTEHDDYFHFLNCLYELGIFDPHTFKFWKNTQEIRSE